MLIRSRFLVHRDRRQFVMKQLLVATCTVFVFGGAQARADVVDGSATGLASSTLTLDFSEVSLAANTAVTNQYASLGVTFSPQVYFDPQTAPWFINDIGNYTSSGSEGPVNPLVMTFSTEQDAVAFQMAADGTPYTISAYLGGQSGTLVETFTDPGISDPVPSLFYGFQNVAFDTIVVSQAGAGGGPYWLIGDIQEGPQQSPVPEPTSLILLSTVLLAVAFVVRKRIAQGL